MRILDKRGIVVGVFALALCVLVLGMAVWYFSTKKVVRNLVLEDVQVRADRFAAITAQAQIPQYWILSPRDIGFDIVESNATKNGELVISNVTFLSPLSPQDVAARYDDFFKEYATQRAYSRIDGSQGNITIFANPESTGQMRIDITSTSTGDSKSTVVMHYEAPDKPDQSLWVR